MPQQTNGFSRITVHTDDDEVVIQAGIRPAASESEAAQAGSSEEIANTAASAFPFAPEEENPDRDTPPSTADATERPAEPAHEPAAAAQPQEPRTSQNVKKASKKNAYRETTADDLDTGPMPVAQKVVIVVAVLLIAGFLVYYNFLR